MHMQVTPASNVPGIGMVMFHGPGPMLPVSGLGGGEPDGCEAFDGDGGAFGAGGLGAGGSGDGGLGDGELEDAGIDGTGFGGGGAIGADGIAGPAVVPLPL